MQIILDTNTVISGLLWHGAPRQLIEALRLQQIAVTSSPELLAELAEVLARKKFSTRIQQAGLSAREMAEDYASLVSIITPPPLPEPICRDPDDDAVLACAVAAQADAIVTGDDDLLSIRLYQGISILTADAATQRI